MYSFTQRLRTLHYILAGVLLLEAAPLAVRGEDETSRIENVRFEVSEGVVFIYYDLLAPLDKVHQVSITLKRESDPLFVYNPINLRGEVGAFVFSGHNRRIMWEISKEYPGGLEGDDFYFVVTAEPPPSVEGTNTLLWVGGGAAAAGVVALILLSKGEEPPPPTGGGFPGPPARPTR